MLSTQSYTQAIPALLILNQDLYSEDYDMLTNLEENPESFDLMMLANSAMLNAHNSIRSNPKAWVPKLQKYLSQFIDEYTVNTSRGRMRTREGKKAVNEAIAFLNK